MSGNTRMRRILIKHRFSLTVFFAVLLGLFLITKWLIFKVDRYNSAYIVLGRLEMDPLIAEKNNELGFQFTFTGDNAKEEASKCDETFNETLEDNLQVIKNYPKGVADQYLHLLGDNQSEPRQVTEYPVLVTAFDESHFRESQALFKSIHILMDNVNYRGKIRCLVYDLGIKSEHLEILKKKSRCELRRFPYEDFPEHVRRLKTYAFKPLVVQRALMDYGFVWWVDASIRVNATSFDIAVKYVKRYGWLFYSNKLKATLTQQTHGGMFEFLGEDRCKFRPWIGEIMSGCTLLYYNRVAQIVARAWATCALNVECITPKGSQIKCVFSQTYDGRCHRYDQSMLGIMARRLYHEQSVYPLDQRLNTIYRVARGEHINYF